MITVIITSSIVILAIAGLVTYLGCRKLNRDLDRNFECVKDFVSYYNITVPKGYVMYHRDGDKKNNRLSNLEMITRAEMLRRNREKMNGKKTNV